MNMTFKSLLFGPAASGSLSFQLVYALFRFYCGISMAIGAGISKVFHKIDEQGGTEWANLAFGVPEWFVKQVGEIGFTIISPTFWAYMAVYGECIGGLLVALGLLTRISALQMAFQFFVVSFIWYDAPMPFAMYYQQLIFWAFVLISATGGGRFSLDQWLTGRSRPAMATTKVALSSLFLLLATSGGFAQTGTAPVRVSFTVSNPSLKNRAIDIRHFDARRQTASGYGYDLNALASHPVNMPAGTRVYEKRKGEWVLVLVLSADDNGRRFDLSQTYEIHPEQRKQAAADEQAEKIVRQQQDAEEAGGRQHLEMVTVRVAGKLPWNRQVYVRAELPGDPGRSSQGFCQKISWFNTHLVRYPVGTKIYLCEGAFWEGPVPEAYVLTLDVSSANDTLRL
ncbi:MAG: DoxX family protein [Saprospiraceae bacterium]|nr:DoxX family protein [Saprospiraceae bacterium]